MAKQTVETIKMTGGSNGPPKDLGQPDCYLAGMKKVYVKDSWGCAQPKYILWDSQCRQHVFDHFVDCKEGLERGLLKKKS